MGPPPIAIYLTTIASQPALRQRQEYLLRILQAKRLPFNSYDLASDEDAKKLWRRTAPADKQQLPGILVGHKFIGTFQDFEEAVEYNELNQFLRRNEEWDEELERPSLPVRPIGVPGASLPMQMTPEHIRTKILAQQQSSPLKGNKIPKPINKIDEASQIDVGEELEGFGLQGVKVTEDELRDMIEQLGLGEDVAEDLLQGLSDNTQKTAPKGSNELKEDVATTEASKVAEETKDKAVGEKENDGDKKQMRDLKDIEGEGEKGSDKSEKA